MRLPKETSFFYIFIYLLRFDLKVLRKDLKLRKENGAKQLSKYVSHMEKYLAENFSEVHKMPDTEKLRIENRINCF